MRLENWCIVSDGDPYLAPEMQKSYLNGKVYGHPRFDEGHYVTTSRIIEVKDGKVHTRSGSVYELGKVDPSYEEQFPKALERLLGNENNVK